MPIIGEIPVIFPDRREFWMVRRVRVDCGISHAFRPIRGSPVSWKKPRISAVIHAQAPAFTTEQINQTDLNNIPGQEVLIFTSVWHPGFRLPLHMHPNGHEFTVVIEGEQTFEIEGVGTKVVKAGEVIYTPPNTPHFGRNATDKISRTVVLRIKDKDKPGDD
jgi:quercetin dioxygenase-like cupin family protein